MMKEAMQSPVKTIIQDLPGVMAIERLEASQLQEVKLRCPTREHNGFADIVYSGLESVLQRHEVWVMLKDSTFRPPPGKTVFMVEDIDGRAPEDPGHILTVETRQFHIIGEEIFKGEGAPEEAHFLLSEGFALFTERRKESKHLPAYFLLPPIGFPELQEQAAELGLQDVVSVSPSAGSDQVLRQLFGFTMDPEYATILIGFNRTGSP